jgi:hypothetical protein
MRDYEINLAVMEMIDAGKIADVFELADRITLSLACAFHMGETHENEEAWRYMSDAKTLIERSRRCFAGDPNPVKARVTFDFPEAPAAPELPPVIAQIERLLTPTPAEDDVLELDEGMERTPPIMGEPQ